MFGVPKRCFRRERCVPVKIESFEPLSDDEFNALRRQKARQANPIMAQLLDEVERGTPVRVPLVDGQTARGLRVAIARLATGRGLTVETLEGDGFVAVRKAEAPGARKQVQSAEPTKRRGRPRRRQDHSLDEVLAVGDNERIVPEPVIET